LIAERCPGNLKSFQQERSVYLEFLDYVDFYTSLAVLRAIAHDGEVSPCRHFQWSLNFERYLPTNEHHHLH